MFDSRLLSQFKVLRVSQLLEVFLVLSLMQVSWSLFHVPIDLLSMNQITSMNRPMFVMTSKCSQIYEQGSK